ncbi:MAG: adenosylcobinamide-GDP ribazoletransferase [Hyphomicrobiales bacterium]
MLNQLKSAFITLTRLPWIKIEDDDFDLKNGLWAFPIVGMTLAALVSLVISLLCWVGVPPMAGAILASITLIILTGALHEDGLADCADALGASTKQRRLEIMRDSHIGAYGTLALIFSVSLRGVVIYLLWQNDATFFALMVSLTASRAAIVMLPFLAKPAREDGLAAAFKDVDLKQLIVAQVILLICGLVFYGTDIIFVMLASLLVTFSIARMTTRKIGGFTGDVLGATEQLVQLTCFLIILVTI